MKSLIILGSGGFAREVAWLIEENNRIHKEWDILGYVTKDNKDCTYHYPALGEDEWLLSYDQPVNVACAIGDPVIRKMLVSRYELKKNISFPTIVSNHAIVADSVSLGKGTIVCAGCIISVNSEIGDYVICDRNSNIGHEVRIDNYTNVSPGVNISGNVHIGFGSMIGTGASIIQGISIGNNTVIGAGATVIENITDDVTAVGVPARVVRKR